MPDTPIRQPDLHRGGLCVPGACGPVPGAGCPGRGRLCGANANSPLRGVLRHHPTALPNHVCRIRIMLAGTALGRIDQVMGAPELKVPEHPKYPPEQPCGICDVSFTLRRCGDACPLPMSPSQRSGTDRGPGRLSGGGKTTAASLIPVSGTPPAREGGRWMCDRSDDPMCSWTRSPLCSRTASVQSLDLGKMSGVARPDATREQVRAALMAAQCGDILEKLPQGMDT